MVETRTTRAAEDLSVVDRAWLLMDRPANPMMIVGLIAFETVIERTALRDVVAQRFTTHPRFRCVPVSSSTGGSWVEGSDFDIDDHVLCRALPAPAGQPELEVLVGELDSTPFPPGRPLWSFHLIDHYGQGSALVVRIHHSYADGIALLRVLFGLADRDPLLRGKCARRTKHATAQAAATESAGLWPCGPPRPRSPKKPYIWRCTRSKTQRWCARPWDWPANSRTWGCSLRTRPRGSSARGRESGGSPGRSRCRFTRFAPSVRRSGAPSTTFSWRRSRERSAAIWTAAAMMYRG